jgi:predicted NUDIX family phosphoesterase
MRIWVAQVDRYVDRNLGSEASGGSRAAFQSPPTAAPPRLTSNRGHPAVSPETFLACVIATEFRPEKGSFGMSLDEEVLVVPTAQFHALGYFQGFSSQADRYLTALLQPQHLAFLKRSIAEDDPSHKQLIPYVIFRCGDLVFHYTRGSGGEKRLHAKKSIGVGGHISTTDAGGSATPYRTGLERELAEEVAIGSPYTDRCLGLINDDETPVGRVHLGIVHVYDLEQPHVTPREDGLADTGFAPLNELLAQLDGFETWSQICLKELAK